MKTKMKLAALIAVFVLGGTIVAEPPLNFALVDSFAIMRETEKGKEASVEIDAVRDKLSKEIQTEAQKITKEETDLKSKAATIKPDLLVKEQRRLDKEKRDLEEKVRESEEEIKLVMQQKTEELAVKVEESIVAVAKDKGVDAVIDKMTGRVMYTKDTKGDLTGDAIAHMNKNSIAVAKQTTQSRATTSS